MEYPKKITAQEFLDNIAADPYWAVNLKEPVEVTEYVFLGSSPIAGLSPLLYFSAKGVSAEFFNCPNIEIAEGRFAAYAGFDSCGVRKIGDLIIEDTHPDGDCASFKCCKLLDVAEGDFPGGVDFSGSGVSRIGNLIVRNPWLKNLEAFQKIYQEAPMLTEPSFDMKKWVSNPIRTKFTSCVNLKVASGEYYCNVDFSYSGVEETDEENLIVHNLPVPPEVNYSNCENMKVATGKYPGVVIYDQSNTHTLSQNFTLTGRIPEGSIRASFWNCPLRNCPEKHLADLSIRIMPENRIELNNRMNAKKAMKTAPEMIM